MHIGIDIGTHTARAAYLDATGRPRLVRFAAGDSALPAMARCTMHGLVVGAEASRSLVGNHETTVVGCTRLMGRAGRIPQRILEHLPYPVRECNGELVCDLLYAEVPASAIYAGIVRSLAEAAARQAGAPVDSVVLAIPAGAEDRFRVQARAAVEALGIRVQRLVNQPAAALLALEHAPGGSAQPARAAASTAAIVNCGGGTIEVSLARRESGRWRMLATVADAELGGDDLCWMVARELNQRFRGNAGIDVFAVGDSAAAAQGLRAAAEEALRHLSLAHETLLTLDHGGGFGRDLLTIVRRSEIDAWLTAPMERVADLCIRALAAAEQRGLQRRPRPVDTLVLLGDWADLPQLRQTIADAFGVPVGTLHTTDAAELAAYGAALAGASGQALVWDVTPYPLGINCYYGETELLSPIIRANTPIPTPRAGARGAFTESYSTRFPDQTLVRLDVLQYRGERDAEPRGQGQVYPHQCEKLGSWTFSGLTPPPGRCADFTVTFAIDDDGVLELHARETATGRTLTARVERGIAG